MSHTPEKTAFDLNDVKAINNKTASYITQLPLTELTRRMQEITIPSFDDPELLENARETLRDFGIVVFPGVIDPAQCDLANQSITELSNRYVQTHESVIEDDKVLFQIGSAKLKGFYKLANYGKTVVTVRQGQDQGMIDIFNCDFALREELGPLRRLFEHKFTLETIGTADLKPQNFNAYINTAIGATRGFHVDSYTEHLKAFIYLTDVTSLSEGPYTYVKGSHTDSPFRRANKNLCAELIPATESPIVDPNAITPIIAAKGSLVISDQAGIHRGWPQDPGRQRVAAVMKYAA